MVEWGILDEEGGVGLVVPNQVSMGFRKQPGASESLLVGQLTTVYDNNLCRALYGIMSTEKCIVPSKNKINYRLFFKFISQCQ